MNITISKTKGAELAETDKVGFSYNVTGERFFSTSSSGPPSFSKVLNIPAPGTYRQGDPAHSISDLVAIYAVAEDTGNANLLLKHLTPAGVEEVKKADSSPTASSDAQSGHALTVKVLLMIKQNSGIVCFYSSKSDSEEDVSAIKIVSTPQGYLVDPLDLDDPSNSILSNIYNKLSDLVIQGDRDAIAVTEK